MVAGAGRRAVFLDRDGVVNATAVINGKPVAPRRVEDFQLLPGVAAAMRRLRRAGFFICIVTNQPDIGNGLVDSGMVAAMHARLRHELPIDEIEMCPHRQIDNCLCRKPKPGMLRTAAKRHRLDLTMSYMVGDRDSDVLAGAAAGCYTVFIHRGYEESRQYLLAADFIAHSLSEAVHIVLSRQAWGH